MKKMFLLVCVMLVSSMGFAGIPSTGLSKNSPELKALGSAWKAHPSIQASQLQKNLTIVYGGQDVGQAEIQAAPIATA